MRHTEIYYVQCLLLFIGSNWASRQGLTDMVRYYFKTLHVQDGEPVANVKLSIGEEVRMNFESLS